MARRVAALGRDLLPLVVDYLDVESIRQWFEVVSLSKAMTPLMADASDWCRDVYLAPCIGSGAPSEARSRARESALRWYAARACKKARTVQLYELADVELLEIVLGSPLATSGRVQVLKLLLVNSQFSTVAQVLIRALSSGTFSNLSHFELLLNPHPGDVGDGDGSDQPHAYELYLALQKHCPALARLEGTPTWPGFGSLHDLVGPRNKAFKWGSLRHQSFFDVLPTEWVERRDPTVWGGLGFSAGQMLPSPLLDEIFEDNDQYLDDDSAAPHFSTRAALQRCFRPFSRTIFPSLRSLELRFYDSQDAQRFFALWHHYAFPPSSQSRSGELPDVCSAQITSLRIHIDYIDPTKQFEQQAFWNSLMRHIDSRRLPAGGALLPNLERLCIDSWMPSSHFVRFLTGSGGGIGLRLLSLCPGDEDPATAAFLEHHWIPASCGPRIAELRLRRRTLSPPGTMFAPYLLDERRLHDAYFGGDYRMAARWSSEFADEDPFAVRGADYGVARGGVVGALCSALREGKLADARTSSLGVPCLLLEALGCGLHGPNTGSARVQREIKKVLARPLAPQLESLTVHFRHEDTLPSSAAAGAEGEASSKQPYTARCLSAAACLLDAWACVLEDDHQAALRHAQEAAVATATAAAAAAARTTVSSDATSISPPPQPALCPLQELVLDLPLASLDAYRPHWHELTGATLGRGRFVLSADQTLGRADGGNRSLLRVTLCAQAGLAKQASSLFLCRES